MPFLEYLRDHMLALLSPPTRVVVFFALGLLALAVVLWCAKPGRRGKKRWAALVGTTAFGLALVAMDSTSAGALAVMRCACVVGTTLLVWRFCRECWTVYLEPWRFSWRNMGVFFGSFVAMGYALTYCAPDPNADVLWGVYAFTQVLAPVFAFQMLLYWGGLALKSVYLGKFLNEDAPTRTVDVFFTLWWNDRVRGQAVDAVAWLSTTATYPQFMTSRWWQKKGELCWPDVMEWHAKLGTSNMVWFLRERMHNPPEVLDDFSHANGLWSFSNGAQAGA